MSQPTVSVAVMAHPRRAHFLPELQARLDRPARLVFDRRNDRWDTGRRAMLAYDKSATHHLVVQDDAVIPRDLVAGIEQALAHVPESSPLCLYCGRVRPYREVIEALVADAGPGTSWLTMAQLHWGVGIVMPTKWISDMIAWCDERTEIANYDRRISRWCQSRGLTVYYPWPSLVDHRDSPSLVPGRGSAGRRAHRFVGADISALRQRWDGKVVSVAKPAGAPVPLPPVRLKQLPKGTRVKFVSTKYPQLQVPIVLDDGTAIRVRFRDGHAATKHPGAIEHLLRLHHMGVAPVGEAVADTSQENGSAAVDSTATVKPSGADTGPDETPEVEAAIEVEAESGAQDGAPATPAEPGEVPTGGAKEILAWVGDDPQKARQALNAEQGREKPRSTLVATLTKLAG